MMDVVARPPLQTWQRLGKRKDFLGGAMQPGHASPHAGGISANARRRVFMVTQLLRCLVASLSASLGRVLESFA